MNARRLLTARVAGGAAVVLAALVVAVGIVGFARSVASPDAVQFLPPIAATIVLVVVVLRLGGSGSRTRRTPYW